MVLKTLGQHLRNKYTEHTERPVSAGLSLSLHAAVVLCYPFYRPYWRRGWCCV